MSCTMLFGCHLLAACKDSHHAAAWLQMGSVRGSQAGGATAVKQRKAELASLIARLRTQRQACQVGGCSLA